MSVLPIKISIHSLLTKSFKVLMFIVLQFVIGDLLLQDFLKYSDTHKIEWSEKAETSADEMDDFEEEKIENDLHNKHTDSHHKYSCLDIGYENLYQFSLKRFINKIPVPPPECS